MLVDDDEEASGTPRGLDTRLEQLLWEQAQAQRRWATTSPVRGEGAPALEPVLEALGTRLGEAYIPKPIAQALNTTIAEAERLGSPLEIGLEVSDEVLANLPWEMLRLPLDSGHALALHPRVDLYRSLSAMGPASSISIPGPLRILVAIGSPEAHNARRDLLDMEAELSRILNAVEPARRLARREGKPLPVVHILETGSVQAIKEALEQQRYHVLYLSCHAEPGALILEDNEGRKDRVDGERLWKEGIPAGQGVPLVVLAGCSTGIETSTDAKEEAKVLPSVARELVTHGVPAVIAMQGTVGDRYATALAERLFQALTTWKSPLPLRALCEARRALEQDRLKIETPQRPPPEWMIDQNGSSNQVRGLVGLSYQF